MKSYTISSIPCRILGRNTKNKNPVALFWGASAVEINVKATEVWAKISADYVNNEPWVAVEVNGFPVSRFVVLKDEPQVVCLARNLNPEKENLISIIKDTQPMPDDSKHSLFVHEIYLNDEGVFLPVKERSVKIEFIGDSITSGEGLAGAPDEMDWITQWFCASKTYAVKTAHELNADWSVFSQCGWGLCWGWDGNRNSNMPAHYENVCSVMSEEKRKMLGGDEKWEFGEGSDFVVLNLGTNDDGAFFQKPWIDENGVEHELNIEEDGKVIFESAINFLKKIRKYNPKAKIIWTWGMIYLKKVTDYIKNAIDQYKKETNDNFVYSLEFDSMENVEVLPEDKGSRSHPGPKTHYLAAKKLTDFLQTLID